MAHIRNTPRSVAAQINPLINADSHRDTVANCATVLEGLQSPCTDTFEFHSHMLVLWVIQGALEYEACQRPRDSRTSQQEASR